MLDEATFLNNFSPVDDRWVNLINLDAMFAVSPDAILLNQWMDSASPDYVQKRNQKILARAGSLGFIAHCDCYNLTGNLNVNPPDTPEGNKIRCSICGTECRDDFSSEKQLEHNLWLGIPPSIPGVLHPIAYIVLSKWLERKKDGPNYIDVIIDPTIDLPPELMDVVQGRGHAYFYENFDRLMAHFLHYYRHVDKRPTSKKRNADYIEMFIRQYRSVMFCTKLPILASVLHSITSSDGVESRQYADASLQGILDAATDLQHIQETTMRTRPKTVPTLIQRVYRTYIDYLLDIAKTRLSKKKSLVRGHMMGTRLHWSARTVIIPHHGRYDEIYLPWTLAVNMLKVHIVGRLMRKHRMTLNEALLRHIMSLIRYDPLIDRIMKDLIEECKPDFRGLPMIVNRNPSLRRGALQLLFATRIKTNVEDKTFNLSTLILKAPNADRI